MPPKASAGETDISLRFKFGIHTVYLLVSPLDTFAKITEDLLEALTERYPDGLSSGTGHSAANDTPIPAGAVVSYGVLQQQSRREGRPAEWRDLKAADNDTAVAKGLKEGMDVAFLLRSLDEADAGGAPEFVVQWPSLDDEDEEVEP